MDRDGALALLAEAELSDELARSPLADRLAVLGTFEPEQLADPDAEAVVDLLCQRLPAQGGRAEAILSERRRIDALVRILERGGQAELAELRRSVAVQVESPLQRMLDAFVLGSGAPVEVRDEDELLASLEVWRWATEAVARARLTGQVTIEPSEDRIESRLALLDVTRAVRRLAEGGCVGRAAELERLHAYRRAPPASGNLVGEPALVVYGIGGVGKSTLVARFVMDLYEDGNERQAWAYLDLDRPTLSSCEPAVVLADIVQQVAAQFPDERRMFERSEEVVRQREKGAGLEAADAAHSYRERVSDFAWALQSITAGSLVVVVDTYEELERNWPEQGEELYDLFAALASELPAFRIIVSGRAPAADFLEASRPDRQLHVLPLTGDAALELLHFFVDYEAKQAARPSTIVDATLGREIIDLVGGIPLTVRLAAKVLVHEGAEAIADAAQRARALDRVRSEFVRGFLYQRILDHVVARDPIDTDELRQLARASIALRRVTVDLVEQVLMPSLDLSPTAAAGDLYKALASEVGLAEQVGDELRLREELRGPALAALRLDDAPLVRRVHERAASFYAQANTEEAALELAYHRLAIGDPATNYDDATLRKLEQSLAGLPASSATEIRRADGDTASLEASRNLAAWERRVLPAADGALRKGDLRRARALLAEREERGASTELHRLESRLAQAEGDLDAATAAARRDLYAAAAAGDPTRHAAAAVRLAQLHELQGDIDGADEALREAGEAPALAGFPALRLELLLNRMNARERTAAETEETRWTLGLDARALIQRSDPRSIVTDTALLRLLAAALGREEPERIREAVRRIGLGREEDEQRVQTLVRALAEWDAAQPEPGRMARASGLRVVSDDADGLQQAWTAVAGLGTDAGLLLDRLWRQAPPPEPVREAIRSIYLWWAVERGQSGAGAAEPPSRPHFLANAPLDWSRKETRELEEIILTAYPTSTDNRALADRAGLDLGDISWASSGRRIAREILGSASRTGRLDDLVLAVLADPSAVSVHAPLRSLLGDEWLAGRDLPA